jgi:hypothetical protein
MASAPCSLSFEEAVVYYMLGTPPFGLFFFFFFFFDCIIGFQVLSRHLLYVKQALVKLF